MRVVVTGSAGFIGSHTTEALLRRGDHVVGIDNFNQFYDPAVKRRNVESIEKTARSTPSSQFVQHTVDIGDAARVDAIVKEFRPDAIVHLAAWAGVRPSIQQPALYAEVNVTGTIHMLEAARKHGVGRFVFASSSSVYGGRTTVPFRETDLVDAPISPYAATKKAGELLCATYNHLYGLPISALRFFTVYGPRQRPEMAIHKFATALLRGEPVAMYGDGSSARDYTFIEDIVQGTVAALDHCAGYEVYNLGEERSVQLRELLELLAAKLGVPLRVREEPMQPGDVPVTFADVSKARSKLGYTPRVSIEQGLERFVQWLRADGG